MFFAHSRAHPTCFAQAEAAAKVAAAEAKVKAEKQAAIAAVAAALEAEKAAEAAAVAGVAAEAAERKAMLCNDADADPTGSSLPWPLWPLPKPKSAAGACSARGAASVDTEALATVLGASSEGSSGGGMLASRVRRAFRSCDAEKTGVVPSERLWKILAAAAPGLVSGLVRGALPVEGADGGEGGGDGGGADGDEGGSDGGSDGLLKPSLVAALLALEEERHRRRGSLLLPEAQQMVNLAASCGAEFAAALAHTTAAAAAGAGAAGASEASMGREGRGLGAAELVAVAAALSTFRRKVALSGEQAVALLDTLKAEAGQTPPTKVAWGGGDAGSAAVRSEQPQEPLSLGSFVALFRFVPLSARLRGEAEAFAAAAPSAVALSLLRPLGMVVNPSGQVSKVSSGGQAEALGLSPGCVVVGLGGNAVGSLAELKCAVAAAKSHGLASVALAFRDPKRLARASATLSQLKARAAKLAHAAAERASAGADANRRRALNAARATALEGAAAREAAARALRQIRVGLAFR